MFLAFFYLRLTLYIYPSLSPFPRLVPEITSKETARKETARRSATKPPTTTQRSRPQIPSIEQSSRVFDSSSYSPFRKITSKLRTFSFPSHFRTLSSIWGPASFLSPYPLPPGRGAPDPVFRSRRPGVSVGG